MRLSIIIPLYNEENTISTVLERIASSGIEKRTSFLEIIIVDDCSTDDSYNRVNLLSKSFSIPIQLFKHEKNMGKGAAVRLGVAKAEGDIILLQDADLELYPEDVPRMMEAMSDLNVSFINGSRYMPGVIRPLHSYKRYLGNAFFSWMTSVLIDVRITDMACGYKLIRKELLDHIVLKENRFGIEAELILKVMRIKKNTIAEVPVRYAPRNSGDGKKLGNGDALKIFWTIFKVGILRKKK